MKKYRSLEIAKMFELHPNTIRMYEENGFISKTKRQPNNYRIFTDKHVLQMKICRYVYGVAFTNHHIRSAGNKLLKAVGDDKLILSRRYLKKYIYAIQNEIDIAERALNSFDDFVNCEKILDDDKTYTRSEIAEMFDITKEAVRNWERNDLVSSRISEISGKIIFNSNEVNRIRIIYMLRQCGYSISAIHRCLLIYDKGDSKLSKEALINTAENEILSAGDRWIIELNKVMKSAVKIEKIIDELETIEI